MSGCSYCRAQPRLLINVLSNRGCTGYLASATCRQVWERSCIGNTVRHRLPTRPPARLPCRSVIAHAQHYLVASMGLEMRAISRANARGRDAAAAAGMLGLHGARAA